jgi:hypothetical protein
VVINYSKDNEYHSQRNNLIIPHSSCNSTSMIMALKQAGVRLPFPPDIQPEDFLTQYLRSETSLKKMELIAPWALDKKTGKAMIPPYEIHRMMEWAINNLLDRKLVTFSTQIPLTSIISQIDNRKGVVLSGLFPLKGKEIHHMVSLAGYMKHQGAISYLIIDDPYGDYKTSYRSHRGNNIPVPLEEALQIFKPANSPHEKWAYLVG